jgi:hypothetical protein
MFQNTGPTLVNLSNDGVCSHLPFWDILVGTDEQKLLFKMLQQWPCIGQLTYTCISKSGFFPTVFAAIC